MYYGIAQRGVGDVGLGLGLGFGSTEADIHVHVELVAYNYPSMRATSAVATTR